LNNVSVSQWNGLFQLCKEFKASFEKNKHTVTIALYPGQETVLNNDNLKHIDLVHMMVYDQWGQHSTMKFFEVSASNIKSKGLPLKKFTLGVPFYARDVTTGQWETYANLVNNNPPSPDEQNQIGGMWFNGRAIIKEKTKNALNNGFGGIMIWEVGQDLPPSHSKSLLNAITDALQETKDQKPTKAEL